MAGMQYRDFAGTNLRVSEIGFGLWTVSTGWWGNYTDEAAIALMHEAFDLGVTLFDAADTYGNGRSEELIAKAFQGRRDQIVIATKVGYDFKNYGDERRGQREIPQDFRPAAIRAATEAALARLSTDYIDLLQLHNIRMEQVDQDDLWVTLQDLHNEGKVRQYGVALGPAIGWLGEAVRAIRKRRPAVVQHIYNLLEQHPGRRIHDCRSRVRRPHDVLDQSATLLRNARGKIYGGNGVSPNDHRSHRPRSWLLNGIKKVEQLRFLESAGDTNTRPSGHSLASLG